MRLAFALQVTGLIFEVIGAAITARPFMTRANLWRMPIVLLAALFRTGRGESYARLAPREPDTDDYRKGILDSLQGFAFLWLGFILQLAGLLIQGPSR